MGTHIFDLRPCSESDCFYSSHSEDPIEQRCIGHLRLDFGSGNEFWTSWWPHTAHRHNDAAFKAEFSELINHLRKSLLKNRASIIYCYLTNPTIEEK